MKIHESEDDGPKRRRAGKLAGRRRAKDDAKVKKTFRLTREATRRIEVHAAMTDVDASALVESLVMRHLRRFVVSDRGEAPAAEPLQSGQDQAGTEAA